MGFNNPSWSWKDLERTLSGETGRDGRAPGSMSWNAGGDSPAWGRNRQPFEAPEDLKSDSERSRRGPGLPSLGGPAYAELHCHSNFSFLDGASHPEELAVEAARLELETLAITDHNGFYGAVRFAEAACKLGVKTVFGAEIGLTVDRAGRLLQGRVIRSEAATDQQTITGLVPDAYAPDPAGTHLLLLADRPEGYARLSRAISEGHLAGEKSAPQFAFDDIVDRCAGHVWVLTGCRKGAVPKALAERGLNAAAHELDKLVAAFGRDRVVVELWDHGDPCDSARNDALYELAQQLSLACICTNNVHYATPAQRKLATAVAAVRARRSLAEIDPWLPAGAGAYLRSGAEQAERFARYPGVVETAAEIGRAAAFDLSLVAPNLPPFPCPPGKSEMAYLRQVVAEGAGRRYGDRPPTQEDLSLRARAWATIDHELALIDQLDFAGYFLIVWDIVEFCRRSNIYCQGRGSAANSAVCYALGVTAADAVSLGLLFERFLSPERDGPPDIDIDIESGRREEVIQYVYERYGRHHTAQVANVITYRSRSSVRDMAKALGHEAGKQDAWTKQVDAWGDVSVTADQQRKERQRLNDVNRDRTIPDEVLDLAQQIEDAPRHLGIHSGGMVICDRPVIEVCPVEWARMEKRSVLQWDKDDCAATGLVKFDLLGLGILTALHYAVDFVRDHRGYEIDFARLPQDDDVYAMLCRADTVGVFQIESRAQMATLPRLKPRKFYDLVVEVALIRPGPIQGGSVHPYIRRRNGEEPVTYLHPLLENSLAKTLGVPLFQEQLMQMAIDVAGFTPAESDELRQAMGSKRSARRMEALKERLYDGMARNGITGDIADNLYVKMKSFANYGFPESHSVSFAYLVYASSWIKHYEPAAFCAALLKAQPMGFWSPHTLVQDARRHGVTVFTPDLNVSGVYATLEVCEGSLGSVAKPVTHGFATAEQVDQRLEEGLAVRLGLGSVRTLGANLAEAIEAERKMNGPFEHAEDLVRRVPDLTLANLEAMATAGVFTDCFGLDRREALWTVGAVAQSRPGRLTGVVTGADAPSLPGMTPVEEAVADLWATGVSPEGHPTIFARQELSELGVLTSNDLWEAESQSTVRVAGVVTHRQRPMTAQGVTFLNLEDEFGLINVVISKGCWERFKSVARSAPAMLIRGRLERSEGVINIVADHLSLLPLPGKTASRDFC